MSTNRNFRVWSHIQFVLILTIVLSINTATLQAETKIQNAAVEVEQHIMNPAYNFTVAPFVLGNGAKSNEEKLNANGNDGDETFVPMPILKTLASWLHPSRKSHNLQKTIKVIDNFDKEPTTLKPNSKVTLNVAQ